MSDLITQKEGIAILDPETSRRIADFERKMKEIQRVEDEIRRAILEEMQEKRKIANQMVKALSNTNEDLLRHDIIIKKL